MIISDIEHVEDVARSPQLETLTGGDGGFDSLSSLFNLAATIYPAASTSILNLGNSGNNTAISLNFSMPIMMVFNYGGGYSGGYGGSGYGRSSFPRCGGRSARRNPVMSA